jgi:hypothetical protein
MVVTVVLNQPAPAGGVAVLPVIVSVLSDGSYDPTNQAGFEFQQTIMIGPGELTAQFPLTYMQPIPQVITPSACKLRTDRFQNTPGSPSPDFEAFEQKVPHPESPILVPETQSAFHRRAQ